jgi:DNA anti-recombination protein RmuC
MELEMLSEEARLILESIANLKGDISEIKTDVRQISGRLGEHDKALVEHTAMLENHDRNILSLYDKVERTDKDVSIHLTEDRIRLEAMEKKETKEDAKGLTKYQIIFGGIGVGFFVVVIGALIERMWPN